MAGTWVGWAFADHEKVVAALELAKESDETWSARLTLPAGHLSRMPVGPFKEVSGKPGTFAGEKVEVQLEGEVLRGSIPFAQVTLELRRGDGLPEPDPQVAAPVGPEARWTFDAGSPVWASPTLHDGQVYIATQGGALHCVRVSDGKARWSHRGDAPLFGSALAVGDRVYLFDDHSVLTCIDAEDGRPIWRKTLGKPTAERILPAADKFDYDYKAVAPLFAESRLYLGTPQGDGLCVDAATGEILWKKPIGGKIRTSPAIDSKGVMFATWDGILTRLDRTNGEPLWSAQPGGQLLSGPTVVGQWVIVGSRNAQIYAYTLSTGEPAWQRFQWFSWVESTPVAVGNRFFVGSSDNRTLRELEASTGGTRWSTVVDGWAWGTPATDGERVYFTTAGSGTDYPMKPQPLGTVGAVDAQTGQLLWKTPFPPEGPGYLSGFVGGPVVSAGVLVAAGLDGKVRGYPIETQTR